jgi:hypothetical protein
LPSGEPVEAFISVADAPRLYQGEVLSNFVERTVRWVATGEDGDEFGFDEVIHPYVVVVSQDCDLEQDAGARSRERQQDEQQRANAVLGRVLLVVASEFERAKDWFPGSDVRKRAKQNKDERYHFLSAIPQPVDAASEGVAALVLDFKRVFTYPMEELLRAIARGETRRRARLITPYAEHLSDRLGYFVQRVGLPRDHHRFDT